MLQVGDKVKVVDDRKGCPTQEDRSKSRIGSLRVDDQYTISTVEKHLVGLEEKGSIKYCAWRFEKISEQFQDAETDGPVVAEVQFDNHGKCYDYFCPFDNAKIGDHAIVKTRYGIPFAVVEIVNLKQHSNKATKRLVSLIDTTDYDAEEAEAKRKASLKADLVLAKANAEALAVSIVQTSMLEETLSKTEEGKAALEQLNAAEAAFNT